MKTKLTQIIPFLFLLQIPLTAQLPQECTYYGDSFTFDSPSIGTVITNPEADISISYNYTIPTEEIEKITDQIVELRDLKQEVASQQLSIQKKEQLLQQKEEAFRNQQLKLDREKKVVDQTQNNVDLAKRNFELEMQKVKEEFQKVIASLPKDIAENESISNKIQELKTTGESILASAENCMTHDFQIYEIKDENNKVTYGFSLDEIRKDPNYVFIDKYIEDYARVKRNNKYGFYDNQGAMAIKIKYDHAEPFSDGVAVVKNFGKWFLINKQEQKIFEFPEENDEKIIYIKNFSKGLFEVKKEGTYSSWFRSSFRFYLFDKTGKKIIEKYKSIAPLDKYGLSLVEKPSSSYRNRRQGIINARGQFVLKCEYNRIGSFNDAGLAIVKRNKNKKSTSNKDYFLEGVINTKGDFVVNCKYSDIEPFDKYNLSRVMNTDSLWGIINTLGKTIVPCKYDDIYPIDSFGLAKFKKKKLHGIINKQGEVVVKANYYGISEFGKNGIAITRGNTKNKEYYTVSGLINTKGAILFEDRYSITRLNSCNKLFLVHTNPISNHGEYFADDEEKYRYKSYYAKIGFVNSNGRLALEPQFSRAYEFDKNGYALVTKYYEETDKHLFGLIDKEGNLLLDCIYNKIVSSFGEDNCAIVQKGREDYVGAVNKNGLEFIPCYFYDIKRTDEGFRVKKYSKSEEVFIVNTYGKCISDNKDKYNRLIKAYHNRN